MAAKAERVGDVRPPYELDDVAKEHREWIDGMYKNECEIEKATK